MTKTSKRPKVYISGPISLGSKTENFAQFMHAQRALIEAGFAPLNPGLTMHEGIAKAFDHETWLEVDLPWVEAADLLIRLPGESKGADREVRAAIEAGVEVLCHDEWCCVENAYVTDDPVGYACQLVRDGDLWCQGHQSCPFKHRHRWPDAFPQTQEAASVSLPQACSCVALEDVTPDWVKEGFVTFACARVAIRKEQEARNDSEVVKRLEDVWEWLCGIEYGQLKIAKLCERTCDCEDECTAGPDEACSVELSDKARKLINEAISKLLGRDEGLPIDTFNEIEAFGEWLVSDLDDIEPKPEPRFPIGSKWLTREGREAEVIAKPDAYFFGSEPDAVFVHHTHGKDAKPFPQMHQADGTHMGDCKKDLIERIDTEPRAGCDKCPPDCEACEAIGSDCGGDEITAADVAKIDAQDHLAAIRAERGKVYGEPRANHQGIAMMWAPMLEPHWQAIKDQKPLPEHVVALLMALLKIDRMRLTFHADNYDDCANYLGFARQWQSGGAA